MKLKGKMLRKKCCKCSEEMSFTEQKCPKCGNESFSLLDHEVNDILYKNERAELSETLFMIIGVLSLIFSISLCLYFKLAWYHSIWLYLCIFSILLPLPFLLESRIFYFRNNIGNDCKHIWTKEKRYISQIFTDVKPWTTDYVDNSSEHTETEERSTTCTKYCKKCGAIYSQKQKKH